MKKSYHSMVVPIALATTARRSCLRCSLSERVLWVVSPVFIASPRVFVVKSSASGNTDAMQSVERVSSVQKSYSRATDVIDDDGDRRGGNEIFDGRNHRRVREKSQAPAGASRSTDMAG